MNDASEAREEKLTAERPESIGESFFDFVRFALFALIIVIPIRLFIAQPFIVSGASMIPSFQNGNYLIIDQISYRLNDPKRGEVVVFRFPLDPKKFLIKRIVGLPGETISIKGDTVTIKNDTSPEGFVWKQGVFTPAGRSAEQTVELGEDEYFVLGDNRGESADSRIWGPLPRTYVTGRPLFRLFPVSKISVFPGKWDSEDQSMATK